MKVKDLYKVDILAFNSKIGYITNIGTTFYEMQSQYPVGSPEYEEINNRLKLCCIEQNRTIDAAKGLKTKEFPKHWTTYQTILETDSEEEKQRKEFENKLVIDKRPEFMKFLYSHYAKEYKNFFDDFNLYCSIVFGKKIKELTDKEKDSDKYKEMIEYYNKKNPLLETNGVMNRLCRYMQQNLKDINKIQKNCDNQKIFEKIYNEKIELDKYKLDLLVEKYKEYFDFKKSKQLKSSEFSTYEQYYKYLRNDCLEKISSNIQELANLSVYICYQMFPSKQKDFCWDVFGNGILENLKLKNKTAKIPHLSESGDVEYLGHKYEFIDLEIKSKENDFMDITSEFENVEDIFSGLDDDFDFEGENLC